MAEIDLKAYTSRAVELEAAIYTQKKLMAEHERILEAKKPVRPEMQKIDKPIAPKEPILMPESASSSIKYLFLTIASIFLFVVAISVESIILGLLGFFMAIGGVLNIFDAEKKRNTAKEYNAREMAEYQRQSTLYPKQREKYENAFAEAEIAFEVAVNRYGDAMAKYDYDYKLTLKQHNDVLISLENALSNLYAQGIIYPKYRNFVAITTINEYLMSGRCSELEGSAGAYNLYEMELRQNIIINQLSNIISNLEQIRQGQFALYQELSRANTTIDSILYEARQTSNNTRLTAYFAAVTAMIEATPKTYVIG